MKKGSGYHNVQIFCRYEIQPGILGPFILPKGGTMRKGMWKETAKRLASIFLAGMIPGDRGYTGFCSSYLLLADVVTADAMAIKNWTWTAEGEEAARNPSVGLVPQDYHRVETALMGGYTSKFWFQAEKAKTITPRNLGRT